jgi:hypothetical protein
MRRVIVIAPHLTVSKGTEIVAVFSDMSEDNITMTVSQDGVSRYDEFGDICFGNQETSSCIWIDKNDVEDIVITKDNIAEHYESMDDEDKRKFGDIISDNLQKRINALMIRLSIDRHTIFNNKNIAQVEMLNSKHITALTLFGAKDTLKPIDDYIAEIKASDEYRKYVVKDEDATILSKDECQSLLKNLVHTRGAISGIEHTLKMIAKIDIKLSLADMPTEENDIRFQFNMGINEDEGVYLDFDLFALRTNTKENGNIVYYITGISPSY